MFERQAGQRAPAGGRGPLKVAARAARPGPTLVLLLGMLLALPLAAQERSWLTLQSTYFRAHTDASHEQALAALTALDQFRAQVLHFTGVRIPSGTSRITVLLLARQDEFLRNAGGAEAGEAVITRGDSTTIIMHAGPYTPVQEWQLRHDYTHWLLSHHPQKLPAWYIEGLAELMAGTITREGRIIVGGAPASRERPAGEDADFNAIVAGSADVHALDTAEAYLMPWALTHYLLLGEHDFREKLDDYLRLHDEGMESLAAFRKVFRTSPERFWRRRVARYLREVPGYEMDLPDALLEARFSFEPASLREVLLELQELQRSRRAGAAAAGSTTGDTVAPGS